MNKYLLIYHEEDNDGLFSGAIFYDYLTTKINVDKKDIHLLGATYNSLNDFILAHRRTSYNELFHSWPSKRSKEGS